MNAFLEPYLSPGDGVIDIGANEGCYSEAYARLVGPSGYVLAVEPDPVALAQCQTRCKKLPQVACLPFAVSDRWSASVPLYRDQERKRNSLWAENRLAPDREGHITVETVTLDSLANGRERLKAIKIDAQGAEMAILNGAPWALQNTNLTWAIEIWPEGLTNAGSSYEALIDKLDAAGLNPVEHEWSFYRERCASMTGHKSCDVVVRHRV